MQSRESACLSLRPAQRGEGGAAAPDEGPWEMGCDRRCSCARAALHRLLPKKHESAPHPRLPPHLLPVATGRRDRHAFSRMCSLHSCDRASLPFAPRQRGEGGAAAPDEGPWEVGSNRRCSIARAARRRLLPKKNESAPHPRLPPHLLPVATGRRDQHAFSRMCSLHSCDSASLPFAPRQRGEGGAAARDEGPWECGRDRRGQGCRSVAARALPDAESPIPAPHTASDSEVKVKSRSFIGGIIMTNGDSSSPTRTGLPISSMLLSMMIGDSLKRKFLIGYFTSPFST